MINKAIIFATQAHQGTFRKGTTTPYILHPMEVAIIVSTMTQNEELIAAALLHDTVEDCESVTLEGINREFGEKVEMLIATESEDKTKTWEERKSYTIEFLATEASEDTKIVALGDKLSNMRAIYRDYKEIGESFWNRFNVKDKEKIGWYYKGLRSSLASMSAYAPYQEYSKLVDEVFGNDNKN